MAGPQHRFSSLEGSPVRRTDPIGLVPVHRPVRGAGVPGARTEPDARRRTIPAGYQRQLPLFIFVMPGVVAVSLSANGDAALGVFGDVLPVLVVALLTGRFRQLVIAELLAVLVS